MTTNVLRAAYLEIEATNFYILPWRESFWLENDPSSGISKLQKDGPPQWLEGIQIGEHCRENFPLK
jgi:hypothetical protein